MWCNPSRRFLAPLLALLALAAAPGACAGADSLQARAEAGCSQEDLPATIITLSEGGEPRVEFEVSGLGSGQVPPVLRMTTGRRTPGAPYLARAAWVGGGERTALSGTLALSDVVPGDHLSGRYDLLAPDGREIAGGFRAPWPRGAVGCG